MFPVGDRIHFEKAVSLHNSGVRDEQEGRRWMGAPQMEDAKCVLAMRFTSSFTLEGPSAASESGRSGSGTSAANLISPIRCQFTHGSLNTDGLLELEAREGLLEGDENDSLYGSRLGGASTCRNALTANGYVSSSSHSSPTSFAGSSCSLASFTLSLPQSQETLSGTQSSVVDSTNSPSHPLPGLDAQRHPLGMHACPSGMKHGSGEAGRPASSPAIMTTISPAPVASSTPTKDSSPAAPVCGDEDGPFAPREFHPVDVQLARMLAGASQALRASPAQLLQVMLNFAPEDYQDLVGAVVESGSSYVHLLACHLHNLRTMAEEAIQGTDEDEDDQQATANTNTAATTTTKIKTEVQDGATSSAAADGGADPCVAAPRGPSAEQDLASPEVKAAREALRASILAQYRRVVGRLIETVLDMAQSKALPPQAFPPPPPPPTPPPPGAQGRGGARARGDGLGRYRASAAGAAAATGTSGSDGWSNSPRSAPPSSPFASRGPPPPPPPPPPPRTSPTNLPNTPAKPSLSRASSAAAGAATAPAALDAHVIHVSPGAGPGTEARELAGKLLQSVVEQLGPDTAAEVVQALHAKGFSTSAPLSLSLPITTPFPAPAAAIATHAQQQAPASSRPAALVVPHRASVGGMLPVGREATEAMGAPIVLGAHGRSHSLSTAVPAPSGRSDAVARSGKPRTTSNGPRYSAATGASQAAAPTASAGAAAAAAAAAATTATWQQQQQLLLQQQESMTLMMQQQLSMQRSAVDGLDGRGGTGMALAYAVAGPDGRVVDAAAWEQLLHHQQQQHQEQQLQRQLLHQQQQQQLQQQEQRLQQLQLHEQEQQLLELLAASNAAQGCYNTLSEQHACKVRSGIKGGAGVGSGHVGSAAGLARLTLTPVQPEANRLALAASTLFKQEYVSELVGGANALWTPAAAVPLAQQRPLVQLASLPYAGQVSSAPVAWRDAIQLQVQKQQEQQQQQELLRQEGLLQYSLLRAASGVHGAFSQQSQSQPRQQSQQQLGPWGTTGYVLSRVPYGATGLVADWTI